MQEITLHTMSSVFFSSQHGLISWRAYVSHMSPSKSLRWKCFAVENGRKPCQICKKNFSLAQFNSLQMITENEVSILPCDMYFNSNFFYFSHLMTKPTKWPVHPAKTQISLGVRPVWSVSLLSAWRNNGSSATHWAHCEDSNQTGRTPRLIWVFAGRTCHFVGFVMTWLISRFCDVGIKINPYKPYKSHCLGPRQSVQTQIRHRRTECPLFAYKNLYSIDRDGRVH